MIKTINPASGEVIETYNTLSLSQMVASLEKCQQAFLSWKETSLLLRTNLMRRVTEILLEKKLFYSTMITQEMGKPISQSRYEIEKCAGFCSYYAEHANDYLQSKHIQTDMRKSFVSYNPTGIILGIMPWNFPFLQVFRFVIPALLLGNGCILKPAPNTTGCGLILEDIFVQAGFPENLFRTFLIENSLVEKIISHPFITGVTFTGSMAVGRLIAETAGRYLKKTVLELGGNDAYLILPDADLELAAEQCLLSSLNNAGQVCTAAKRMIVLDAIRKKFENLIVEKAKKYSYGNPLDETTFLGPLARLDLRSRVQYQVMESITQGAQLVMGGHIPECAGYFYPTTIIKNVQQGMPAYHCELFGPVISLIAAKNESEAITIANDSEFGLSASVFTKDLERGVQIATKINVGTCYINKLVTSDPRLPFGGTKNSGYGRELAEEGFKEFANIKTIGIA